MPSTISGPKIHDFWSQLFPFPFYFKIPIQCLYRISDTHQIRLSTYIPSTLTESPKVIYKGKQRDCVRAEQQVFLIKLSRVLLFLYLAMIVIQPIAPILSDSLAHTWYQQRHLMQVHEVKGSFHIHTDLEVSLGTADHHKSKARYQYELPQYLVPILSTFNYGHICARAVPTSVYADQAGINYCYRHYPPPQVG